VIDAARNLTATVVRRLLQVHKPFVRRMRRMERTREQASRVAAAASVEREIAAIARSGRPIVAGPWLAEVGYEALYWVPFLRWFQDAHRLPPDQITVVSRGGVEWWYRGIADSYVDLFDSFTPTDLASANEDRQRREEDGGRKQSSRGSLDAQILDRLRPQLPDRHAVLHPSLMFRLFRDVWHGGLPVELLWSHTDYVRLSPPPSPPFDLPADYVAVKLYTGPALPDTPQNRDLLRGVVERVAESLPIVLLDTGVAVDDHTDYVFSGVRNVINARPWMTPRNNLGLQTALLARARYFLGTCGGLVWLAPFLGVPAVGVYADDRQLAPHLLTVRQAGRRAGAAELSLLDLRAVTQLGASPSTALRASPLELLRHAASVRSGS
jgi:hypothetical protein